MHAEIAALARKHRIDPALLADLAALWGRTSAGASTLDGFASVDLDPPRAAPAEAAPLCARFSDRIRAGRAGRH